MMLASEPSRRQRRNGDIFCVATFNHATNDESIKQCDEPESISAGAGVEDGMDRRVSKEMRQSGSSKAATLRRAKGIAQLESTRLPICAS
jgi:hypothetical protein